MREISCQEHVQTPVTHTDDTLALSETTLLARSKSRHHRVNAYCLSFKHQELTLGLKGLKLVFCSEDFSVGVRLEVSHHDNSH